MDEWEDIAVGADDEWEDVAVGPPSLTSSEGAPAWGKAASGYLSGIASMADFGQMLVNPSRMFMPEEQRGPGFGDTIRSGLDAITGVKDSTRIGEGGGVHTAASYLPGFAVGPSSRAANLAQTLFSAGAAGVGRELGGDTGEIIGAGVSLLAPTVGSKALTKAGQALQRKSVGLNYTDYLRNSDTVGRIDLPEGNLESFTKAAADDLISSGKLGNSRDPIKLKSVVDKAQKFLGKEIGKVVEAADEAIEAVPPRFERALRMLDSGQIPADEIPRYERRLSEMIKNIATEGKNKLSYLQQQKIAVGGKWNPNDGVSNAFNRALYNDLQETIEKAVPNIKPLNQELAKYKALDSVLKRGVARAENADAISSITKAHATTGGFGVPILAGGMAAGGPGAAAGALAATAMSAARTPQGQNAIGRFLLGAAESSPGYARELLTAVNATEDPARALFGSVGQQINTEDIGSPPAVDTPSPTLSRTDRQAPQSAQASKSLEGKSSPSKSRPNPAQIQGKSKKGIAEELFGKSPKVKEIEAVIDSDPFDAAVYEVESGRNPTAKNKKSSAKGAFQLIDQTAKSLGVKDPLDLAQNYAGFKKLTEEHKKQFGENPKVLYAAHYLGAPLLKKVLADEKLSAKEDKLVSELLEKVMPRFERIYQAKLS